MIGEKKDNVILYVGNSLKLIDRRTNKKINIGDILDIRTGREYDEPDSNLYREITHIKTNSGFIIER
jgi:hypothetical protein